VWPILSFCERGDWARASASTDRPRRFFSVRLLIAKGIFAEDEYADVLNDGLEREVKSYELELS
jgi:hypothetical protein